MNCISNANHIASNIVVFDASNNVIASAPSGTWYPVTIWMTPPWDDHPIDSGNVVWTLELRPGITGDANTFRDLLVKNPRQFFTVQYDLDGKTILKELMLSSTSVNTLTGALVSLRFELQPALIRR